MLTIAMLTLISAPQEVVVARVGDHKILAADVLARAELARGQGENLSWEAVVDELIGEALLADEGYRAGLAKDPKVKEAIEAERRKLAAAAFLEKELNSLAKIDDALLRELYHQGADSAKLDMIVVATHPEGVALLERLQKGAKLEEEAKHSLDPATKAGKGDYGHRTRTQLDPGLAASVFEAPIGAFQGPLPLSLGWAVFRVRERTIGDEKGFLAKKAALLRFAEQQTKAQLKGHYLQQLRAKEKITLDEEFLRSLGSRVAPSPKEAEHPVATVGTRVIRYREVADALRELAAGKQGGHFTGPGVKTQYAWQVVEQALLEREAMSKGYGETPEMSLKVRRVERDAVLRAAAARIAERAAPPSESDIKAFYATRVEAFRRPTRRHCANVLFPTREEAIELKKKLASGPPQALEELARTRAAEGKGGGAGEVHEDSINALDSPKGDPRLAAAMRVVGVVSDPIETKEGFIVVRCGDRIPAGIAPLEEVRGSIIQALKPQRGNEHVKKRLAELRSSARVEIDEDAIRRWMDQGG